ncbi:MAG TPA: response regulator [Myxococcota bacterium]|nr:response regulator [Myxococcota bacterium]
MTERTLSLLVVDDDRDDQELLAEALADAGFAHPVVFVDDGTELLDYLHRRDRFTDRDAYPDPSLILLDLQMPRMEGMEALAKLHDYENLWRIPVVVMTTSWSENDIARAYDLGVNAFLMKPVLYEELVEQVRALVTFWFRHAELPSI